MQKYFVLATCDVRCAWTGDYPRYRVYVNNELFAERTWIWRDVFLQENIQIEAPAGCYKINVELLDTEHASLDIRNMRIVKGPAIITDDGQIVISRQD